jgi:hypothetical protein
LPFEHGIDQTALPDAGRSLDPERREPVDAQTPRDEMANRLTLMLSPDERETEGTVTV